MEIEFRYVLKLHGIARVWEPFFLQRGWWT